MNRDNHDREWTPGPLQVVKVAGALKGVNDGDYTLAITGFGR